MSRCPKHRCCRQLDQGGRIYKPRAIPFSDLEMVKVGLDEFEALRLCDLENHDQEAAGQAMGISRGTVQRLLKSGRQKLVGALLHQQALVIHDQEREQ